MQVSTYCTIQAAREKEFDDQIIALRWCSNRFGTSPSLDGSCDLLTSGLVLMTFSSLFFFSFLLNF